MTIFSTIIPRQLTHFNYIFYTITIGQSVTQWCKTKSASDKRHHTMTFGFGKIIVTYTVINFS